MHHARFTVATLVLFVLHAPIALAGGGLATLHVTVDVEQRVLVESFGGDTEAARAYFETVYDNLDTVFQRDASVVLEVTEFVFWSEPAPFELTPITSGGATTGDRLNAYRSWVIANRQDGFLQFNHLWGATSVDAGTAYGLGSVNAFCNGGYAFMQLLDAQDEFIASFVAGRYLGIALGASATTDDTLMDPAFDDDTTLAYSAGTVSEIQSVVLGTPPCDAPVLMQCNRPISAGQIPYADNTLATIAYESDTETTITSDNFAALTGTVRTVRWWGMVDGDCTLPLTFQISATGDASGTWSVQPTIRDTGLVFSGTPAVANDLEIIEFEAELPTTLFTTGGSIAIANEDAGCTFYWIDSPVSGAKAALPGGTNAAFCLYDPAPEIQPIEELGCPGDSTFSQPAGAIDQSAFTAVSDQEANTAIYEQYSEIGGPITRVTWWGLFLDDVDESPCAPSSGNFTVRFYQNGASPGALEALRSTTPTTESISSSTLGTVTRYTMHIFPAVDLNGGWLSVQASGHAGCDFHWLGARAGDGIAAAADGANPAMTFEGDLAFCIKADLPFAPHSADTDMDAAFTLSEVLRVIQLYNAGAFGCDGTSEDGYTLDTMDSTCDPHDSDYAPQDWLITLSELLRLIQLFANGDYDNCASEDGFCTVP
jgi:hypothetical protein